MRSRRRCNCRRRGSVSTSGSGSAANGGHRVLILLDDLSIATVRSAVVEMKVTCIVVIVSCDTAVWTAAEAAVIYPTTPARRLRLGRKQRRGNAAAYAKGGRSADTIAPNAPADPSAIADSHRVERNRRELTSRLGPAVRRRRGSGDAGGAVQRRSGAREDRRRGAATHRRGDH